MEQNRAIRKAVHDSERRQKLTNRSLGEGPVAVAHALAVFPVRQIANRAAVSNARAKAVFALGRFFLVEVAHAVVSL
jgi:hypothetical protein